MGRPSLKGKTDPKVKSDFNNSKLQKEEKLQKYKESYKNILWIDDRDDKDAEPEPLKWMEHWLEDSSETQYIEQVDLFQSAVEKISKNYYQYDLVIFDINMEKGFMESTDKPDYLKEEFKKCHISFDYAKISSEEGKKTAGIYLYLLLLSKGYPLERMLIYTGNGAAVMNDQIKDKLGYFNFDDNIFKKKETEHSFSTEPYFQGNNSYYFVRRLVFQACEYWKDQLKNKKNSEISFNQLYFGDNAEKQGIGANEFIEKLDTLELMMPVSRPANPEKIYYQIIQNLSAFHEGKVDITKINNYPDLKKYHCCMRNFRNWSAHNKLNRKKIEKKYFLIMFCIALRTYFNGKPEQQNFDTDLYDYEKICNFNNSEETDFSKIEETLKECFKETAANLKDYKTKTVKSSLYLDLDEMIREYSKNPEAKMEMKYIFLPIWSDKKLLTAEETAEETNVSEDLTENQEISIIKTKKVKWSFNNDCFKNLCQKSEENNADGIFMKYCAQFLK